MHKTLNVQAPAVSSLVPAVGPALDRFIARMLAKKPDERFRNADEAKAAFLQALDAPAPADPGKDRRAPSSAYPS
jgi:hypothetical protein